KGTSHMPGTVRPPESIGISAESPPAHYLGALTLRELVIPGLFLFSIVWIRWFQMGASFLRKKLPDPMRRVPIGIFFGFCGMFLQCLTEWVFRHLPLYYVFHILLGSLMSLYFIKRQSSKNPQVQTNSSKIEREH